MPNKENMRMNFVAQVEFYPTCVAGENAGYVHPSDELYPWPESPARAGLRHGWSNDKKWKI